MASGEKSFLAIACSSCGRKLKAPERLLGKTLPCPACNAPIVLSAKVINPSDENLREVDSNASAKTATNTNGLDQELDEFGFQFASIVEKPPESASVIPHVETSSLPTIPDLSHPMLGGELDLNQQSAGEFRFPCKVCGTGMYARPSEIGNTTRCPDCFSEFTIPSPPKVAPKKSGPTLEGAPDVALVPVEAKKKVAGEIGRSSADDYLARAAKELDDDDEKNPTIIHDFDTAGWIKGIFSFLGDPTLIAIGLASGGLIGGVLVLASMFEVMLAAKSENASHFGGMLVMILLGTPLLLGNLGNGIAVLEMSANRMNRVPRWPMFNPFDAMGEITLVAAAFAFAALPGGILGWVVTSMLGWDQAISFGFVLLSTGLLFPVFLLGMLDSQSIGQPFSAEVMQSIPARSEAWASMYLLTAIAMAGIFLGWLGARGSSPMGKMIYGVILPFLIYFIFHQFGVLASRISFAINEDNDQVKGEDNQKELEA